MEPLKKILLKKEKRNSNKTNLIKKSFVHTINCCNSKQQTPDETWKKRSHFFCRELPFLSHSSVVYSDTMNFDFQNWIFYKKCCFKLALHHLTQMQTYLNANAKWMFNNKFICSKNLFIELASSLKRVLELEKKHESINSASSNRFPLFLLLLKLLFLKGVSISLLRNFWEIDNRYY